MKIHNNHNITKAMKIYNSPKKNNPVDSACRVEQTKDQLQLSENAKEFQVALKAFRNLPDIRAEKVKEIKDQMQQGTYNVSGKEVADKMIESLMFDKKL